MAKLYEILTHDFCSHFRFVLSVIVGEEDRASAEVKRPCDVPEEGLVCDLLWSDPEPDITGWAENDRGVSYVPRRAKFLRAFYTE